MLFANTQKQVSSRQIMLLETLQKAGGIMQGWGKHYRFCNDMICFERLDREVQTLIRTHIAIYREEWGKTDDAGRWRLLGIEALAQIERKPFIWPKKIVKANTGG